MKTPETNLLDLLRSGEMLRFVLRKDGEGNVRCLVEGAAADGDSGSFAQRLDFLLRRQRAQGYAFGGGGAPADESDSLKWVELRPKAFSIHRPSGVKMGFAGQGEPDGSGDSICACPAYPMTLANEPEGALLHLLRDTPELALVEMEFTRVDLSESDLRQVETSLKHQQAGSPLQPAQDDSIAPVEAFLSQWVKHRSGLRAVLRVALDGTLDLPTPVLEHIGSLCFHCPCEILDRHPVGAHFETANGGLDLSDTFPERWLLPALLPRSGQQDALSAAALLNRDLPKLPSTGTRIGTVERREVRLPRESRDRHTYIVGGTGTGKSTLLARMIREDMKRGEGVILLDPHGDLYDEVSNTVPAKRAGDVVRINPLCDEDCPGLNILDIPAGPLRRRHTELMIGDLIGCFQRIWGDNKEAFGPMFESYFRGSIELLVYQDRETLNLSSFDRVFFDRDFRYELLEHCTEAATRNFWEGIAAKAGGEASLSNVAPYVTSKLGPILRGSFLSKLLSARHDELQMSDRINRKPILLVNLNKGVIGEHESRVLGVLILSKILSAAISRSLLPREKRSPVNLYVDEFQNFVSDSVGGMVSEARKFGLRLTFANQNLAQLRNSQTGDGLLETVLGNVGNMLLFRLGVPDTGKLADFLQPFTRETMETLPNYHCLCRLLTADGPIRPFIMQTLPPE